jgi:hypothetical protein
MSVVSGLLKLSQAPRSVELPEIDMETLGAFRALICHCGWVLNHRQGINATFVSARCPERVSPNIPAKPVPTYYSVPVDKLWLKTLLKRATNPFQSRSVTCGPKPDSKISLQAIGLPDTSPSVSRNGNSYQVLPGLNSKISNIITVLCSLSVRSTDTQSVFQPGRISSHPSAS